METEDFLRIIFRQSFRFQICEFQDVILGCWIFTRNPLRHYFGGGVGFTWGGPISGLWSWIPIIRSWLWSWLWRFSGRPGLSSKHNGWLSGCSTAVGPATTRQGLSLQKCLFLCLNLKAQWVLENTTSKFQSFNNIPYQTQKKSRQKLM